MPRVSGPLSVMGLSVSARLVGVKQYEGADITICPVEHLRGERL